MHEQVNERMNGQHDKTYIPRYIGLRIFYLHATYKISRSKHKLFLSFLAAKRHYGWTVRWMNRLNGGKVQTDMSPQLLPSWGNKNILWRDFSFSFPTFWQ